MAKLLSAGNNLSGNWFAETANRIPRASDYVSISVDQFTEVFTAPNIVNSAVGTAFMIDDLPSSSLGVWTLTLQEDATGAFSGSEADVATGTWDMDTNRPQDTDQLFWIALSSPYQFTTTNAGSYRWKLRTTGGSNNRVRQSSTSATNWCYCCFDTRTSVPINTDTLFVVHPGTKIDADLTIGTGVTGKGWVWTHACYVLTGGDIDFDSGGSYKLTCNGTITAQGGGQFGSGAALDSSVTGTLEFTPAADGDYYLWIGRGCRTHLVGATRDISAMYASGDGSTGTPLKTDVDIGLAINELIVVTATNGIEETEEKYIKSGTHAAGWVLSDTAGGAESALTNTHTTDAYVLSMHRNLKITTDDPSKGWRIDDDKTNTDYAAANDVDNSVYQYVQMFHYTNIAVIDHQFTGNVFYDTTSFGAGVTINTRAANIHEYNIYCRGDNMTGGLDCLVSYSAAKIQTENASFFVISNTNALYVGGVKNVFNNCKFLDLNWLSSNQGGAVGRLVNPIDCTFANCEIDACQDNVIRLRSNATNLQFINCSLGKNVPCEKTIEADLDAYFWTMLFNNCALNDTLFATDDDLHGGLLGSKISIHEYDKTDNRHVVYETYGDFESCGAGLPDTNTHVVGHLCGRLSPRNLDVGIFRDYLIPAAAVSSVSFITFIEENTAFFSDVNAVCTVDLFLPGSTSPDMTCNFSDRITSANNFEVCSVFGSYEGSISSMARIRITAKSETAGAYVYFADFWNGTNEITNLNTWENAELSPVMMQDFANPASVWEVLENSTLTPGTHGRKMRRIQVHDR